MATTRIKAHINNWNSIINDSKKLSLINFFMNNSKLFMYGVFDGDKYQHLSCNWENTYRAVHCDTNGELFIAKDKCSSYTLNIPYTDEDVFTNDDPNSADYPPYAALADKEYKFPLVNSSLVENVTSMKYIKYYYNESPEPRAEICCVPITNSIKLTTYVNGEDNTDPNIKPYSISNSDKLFSTYITKFGSVTNNTVNYDLESDTFTISSGGSHTTAKYKFGIWPFDIRPNGSIKDTEIDVNEIKDNYKFVLTAGEYKITNGDQVDNDSKPVVFYFTQEDVTPTCVLLQTDYKENDYNVLPRNLIFPLFLNGYSTSPCGIAYMTMVIVDGSDVKDGDITFNGGSNKVSLALHPITE